jgi:stringent starvation protein B
VPRLTAHGVRVFAFPAPPQAQSDAWIEALDVPEGVRRDEPVSLTVHVVSQRETPARITVSADGRALGARRIRLNAGSNAVAIATRIARSGSVIIGVAVHAEGDLLADNDRLQQSAWIGPRPRVLYVEGQPEAAQYLSAALRREGLEVQPVGAEELPGELAALERFDAVILSDVAPERIDVARMQALQRYVRERGGGLIFAAGDSTYGKDGFADTVLERVLPVEFKSREKR